MRISEWLKGLSRPRVEPKIVDTTAFEPLMAVLKDGDPAVRRQAVIALALVVPDLVKRNGVTAPTTKADGLSLPHDPEIVSFFS
jgi:hypothetical protein